MKNRIVTAVSILAFLGSTAVFSRPGQSSLRSTSTGGLFGNSYDILINSPYFLSLVKESKDKGNKTVKEAANEDGSSLNSKAPMAFSNDYTLGKNIFFTGMNDVNNDGSLFLGGIKNFGALTFGTFLEFRKYKQAGSLSTISLGQNFNANSDTTFGSTDLSGTVLNGKNGEAAENRQDIFDPSKTGNATEEASLQTQGENYTDYANVNFKLAGSYTLNSSTSAGFAFERYTYGTDSLGNTLASQSISQSGVYDFLHKDLLTGKTDYSYKQKVDNEDDYSSSHNIFSLYGSMQGLGPFSLFVANVDIDMNSTSRTKVSSDNLTMADLLESTDAKEKNTVNYDDSGILITPSVSAWLPLASWELQTTLSMILGSSAKQNIGKDVLTQDVVVKNLANSSMVNNSSLNNTDENILKSNSAFAYGLDLFARRKLNKKTLFGFGLSYQHFNEDYTVATSTDYKKINTVNDGNGADDAGDYTQTISSSSTVELQTINTVDIFTLPIGIEYFITENFSLRLGYVYNITVDQTETKQKLTKEEPEKIDMDSAAVAGNESTNDVYTSSNTENTNRSNNNIERNIEQFNQLSLGFGYKAGKNLQFDMGIQSNAESFGSGQQFFDASRLRFNATLLF